MAKYNKLEKFGIMVIIILVVIIAIGIVLVLNNRSNKEGMITEEEKRTNQQISEDIQTQETLPTENNEKVEFSESKESKEIESKEYNKEIDRSKPVLIF